MTPPARNPPTTRMRALLHGLGEVAAFVGAAAYALWSFCTGRWPEFRPRRKPPHAPHAPVAEKVTSFPAHD